MVFFMHAHVAVRGEGGGMPCLVLIHILAAWAVVVGGFRWMSGCIMRQNYMYTHKHTYIFNPLLLRYCHITVWLSCQ